MLRKFLALVLVVVASSPAVAVVVPMTLTFDTPTSSVNTLTLRIDASYTLLWKDTDYDTDTAQVLSGSTAKLNVGYAFNADTRAITSISSMEFTGGRYALENTHFDLTLWGVAVDVDGTSIAGTLDTVTPPGSITTYGSGSATFPMTEHKTKINEGTIAIDSSFYSSTTTLSTDPITAIFTSGAGTITTGAPSVSGNVATYSVGISLPVVFSQDIDTGNADVTAKVSGSGTFVAHGTFTKQLPVAVNDTYSTAEDTALSIAAAGVLTNDTYASGSTLTATKLTNPSHGTVSFNAATGAFVYTPTGNYNGADSFTYRFSDGTFNSGTGTVNLTVTSVNDLPVSLADSYSGSEDAAISIAAKGVLANDTDVESATLSAVKITNPSHGAVALNADGSFTYTPAANYYGSDSFTYKANDGGGDSGTATVSLTVASVNDLPVAVADTYGGAEDAPLTVYAANGVLKNDTDADNTDFDAAQNDTLTASIVSGPAGGTLTLYSTGAVQYIPYANWHGTDAFTYKVSDGHGLSNVATVNIDVVSVNDAPIAADDAYNCDAGKTTIVYAANGVIKNDADPDNTDNDTAHNDALTAVKQSDPSHGTLAWYSSGAFTYMPAAGYSGADSFTYKTYDGATYSNLATVLLQIAAAVAVPGDANSDGTVNQSDAAIVAQRWGQSASGPSQGDFNGDGVVNAADASIMAANWGRGAGEAAAVPEPTTLALLAAILVTLGLLRPRK